MRHYAARVRCPKCGYEFSVCVHTVRRPELRRTYVVTCPDNGSPVRILESALAAVDACPEGAVVISGQR
jgi:transposase-like protein